MNWLNRYFSDYLSLDGITDYKSDHVFSIENTTEKIYSSIKSFNRKEWINNLNNELLDFLDILQCFAPGSPVCLYLLDRQNNNFKKEVVAEQRTKDKPQVLQLNDILVAPVVKNRKPVSFPRGSESAYHTADKDQEGSTAILPLLVKKQLFGIILLESKEGDFFAGKKLEQLGKTVSIIEKYVEIHIDRFLSDNRGNLFQAFFEINEIISVPQSKHQIYEILCKLFARVFECDRVIFTSYDLKSTKAKIEKIYGIEDVVYEGQILRELSNMQRAVIETRSPLYVEDLKSDGYYGDRFSAAGCSETNLTALTLTPIIAKERVIGSFQLEFIKTKLNIGNYLPLFQRLGNIIGSVIEKVQLYKKMEKMATLDYVTGLYLKREFVKIIRIEIERSRRNNLPLGLLMIDIDKFKTINDTYGHLTGDKVLKSVAQVIQSSIRNIDFASRYAGDEFCVILLNSNQEQAKVSAERIRKNVANVPILSGTKKINITVSIGASILHNGIAGYKELLSEADEAMYYGRRNGLRNISTLYDYDTDKNGK